jgi:DNA-binding GntR family transcriptional regulator
VPSLGFEELTDLRNVRLEVETLAVKWALANRDDAFVADLEKLLKRLEATERSGDVQGHIKANYEFHLRIYQQSNSQVLVDVINTLWLRVSPHLYQLERENHYKVSNNHHRKIVQAIREGDEATAVQELFLDISNAYQVLVKTLFAESSSR